ncbi:MAG: glutamate 5-kinase [Rhodoluna sp.]|nr:glutamate 5-kinase [Rhodoluna sp.]MBP6186170.1 glutamate 5-kinase [Rhodoluna sp.]
MVLHNQTDLVSAKRVVVKVGSSSISGENQHKIEKLVDALAAAHKTGQEVILVTSGAIATGMPLLKLESKPEDLATSQALASVGQGRLISRYQTSLERYDLIAGQVLLTAQDLEGAETRENAKRAMERLVSLRVIPIVNENDTVATAEIRFGDNDRLAALVAVLVDADALILLSDVDALYDMPPSKPGAKRIERVAFGDELAGVEIGGSGSTVGTGGAVTKVSAAKVATEVGVSVLLTSSDLVAEALTGQNVGTWFEAKEH